MTSTPAPTGSPVASVSGLLDAIAGVGTDSERGGYSRPVYSHAELELREWFTGEASARGLDLETDRNGILWAWWNPAGHDHRGSVVTGSHLDSVPGGGAFDGPLGVASALAAVDHLVARGMTPDRPLALTVFPEEEGSRFGRPCLGSLLLTGDLDPAEVLGVRDSSGITMAEAFAANGLDPAHLGRDDEAMARIGTFVELHCEQGRGLVDTDSPVGVASSILAHGRWRIRFVGRGDHAGTTLMGDRHDPVVAAARTTVEIQRIARAHPGARATVGRVLPRPGGTNVIASSCDISLDVRHADDAVAAHVVSEISAAAVSCALDEGCTAEVVRESLSPSVEFDTGLRDRLSGTLPAAPVLATGAGHDAGILSAHVPTGMLFVRNPSGVSHSPEEFVERADAELGAAALADVLADLLTG